MNLQYQPITKEYIHYSKLKHLYEHAFPKVERPPFKMLMDFSNHIMYGVEDNNKFIGLVDIIIFKDTLYIFFLAIKKTFRRKGYGHQILNYISNTYNNYRIYLMAEDPDIGEDKEMRKRRIKFYKESGFTLSNIKIIEFGVSYVLLYKNGIVNKEEFLLTMLHLLGDNHFKYYQNNINW